MKIYKNQLTFIPECEAKESPEVQLSVTIKPLNRGDFLALNKYDEKEIREHPRDYVEYEKGILTKYCKLNRNGEIISVESLYSDARYSEIINDILQKLMDFSILNEYEKKT